MKLFVALSFLAFASASSILLTKDQECDLPPECPGGCCPMAGWECCPDGLYCAPTLEDCPNQIQLTKMTDPTQCDCGPMCRDGCCPNCGWECCPGGYYCAPTLGDCPKKILLTKKAAPKQRDYGDCCYGNCDCYGTCCPGGCCYGGYDWACCPDSIYCAATLDDCPVVTKKTQFTKMAAPKECDGTPCPGGCCPNVGWYCCPDDVYCAATAADCPFAQKYLNRLAAKIKKY